MDSYARGSASYHQNTRTVYRGSQLPSYRPQTQHRQRQRPPQVCSHLPRAHTAPAKLAPGPNMREYRTSQAEQQRRARIHGWKDSGGSVGAQLGSLATMGMPGRGSTYAGFQTGGDAGAYIGSLIGHVIEDTRWNLNRFTGAVMGQKRYGADY